MTGHLIVLEGPGGAGKTTVFDALRTRFPAAVFVKERGTRMNQREIDQYELDRTDCQFCKEEASLNRHLGPLGFLLLLILNFFCSPTSPRGRHVRVARLVENGASEERAWAVVLTRDMERGVTNFTNVEKATASNIRERGGTPLMNPRGCRCEAFIHHGRTCPKVDDGSWPFDGDFCLGCTYWVHPLPWWDRALETLSIVLPWGTGDPNGLLRRQIFRRRLREWRQTNAR